MRYYCAKQPRLTIDFCVCGGRFEKALKDKLIQKSNAKMSEEACLMKMFKYFDIMNRGAVDFGQFQRVLEKSGMYYPEE